MPKGQPRDARSRAQEIEDRIKALRDEKLDILRDDAAKEKLKKERKAKLLGLTILDDEHITPQEMSIISRILGRRQGPEPKFWNLLSDWLPPTDATAHPANDPKPATREPEFARTGK